MLTDPDFQHLRDGWVRGIQARSARSPAYDDEHFSRALAQFKALFGGFKKSVPKHRPLLLLRDRHGALSVLFDPSAAGEGTAVQRLGDVADPRLAKALWLCYLAGKAPASAPARENIVTGVLRPPQSGE